MVLRLILSLFIFFFGFFGLAAGNNPFEAGERLHKGEAEACFLDSINPGEFFGRSNPNFHIYHSCRMIARIIKKYSKGENSHPLVRRIETAQNNCSDHLSGIKFYQYDNVKEYRRCLYGNMKYGLNMKEFEKKAITMLGDLNIANKLDFPRLIQRFRDRYEERRSLIQQKVIDRSEQHCSRDFEKWSAQITTQSGQLAEKSRFMAACALEFISVSPAMFLVNNDMFDEWIRKNWSLAFSGVATIDIHSPSLEEPRSQ